VLLKNYIFKFKLIPTLIFAITFCGFIVLGFWQIDRADQKNVLNSNYTDRQQEAIIVLDKNNVIDEKSSLLWRKVEFEGSFKYIFNLLFITLFVASASKRTIMIYNYRKDD
jgi:cytochrome oxidase assembly protein ShyY1